MMTTTASSVGTLYTRGNISIAFTALFEDLLDDACARLVLSDVSLMHRDRVPLGQLGFG